MKRTKRWNTYVHDEPSSAGTLLDIFKAKFKSEGVTYQLQRQHMADLQACLLYTSPSPRDQRGYRMPSSA